MGFTYESRFKKKYNLEKNWNMSVQDIVDITGVDYDLLVQIYTEALSETKSRSLSINAVCGYCLKVLFPKEKTKQDTNVPT